MVERELGRMTVTIFLIKMWYHIPKTGSYGSALLHRKVRNVGASRVSQCCMHLLSWKKKKRNIYPLFFALVLNPLKWQIFSLLTSNLHSRKTMLISVFGWRNHIFTVLPPTSNEWEVQAEISVMGRIIKLLGAKKCSFKQWKLLIHWGREIKLCSCHDK